MACFRFLRHHATPRELVRQTIHLIFGPTIFDRRVLAFDKAGFLQALTKAAQTVRNPLKRSGIEKSDPQESLTVARLRTAAT